MLEVFWKAVLDTGECTLYLISFSNVQVSYFQLSHRLLQCRFFVSLHWHRVGKVDTVQEAVGLIGRDITRAGVPDIAK